MKLSTGRGIKFFKKPTFSGSKTFVANTFNAGKKQLSDVFLNLSKNFGNKKKGK